MNALTSWFDTLSPAGWMLISCIPLLLIHSFLHRKRLETNSPLYWRVPSMNDIVKVAVLFIGAVLIKKVVLASLSKNEPDLAIAMMLGAVLMAYVVIGEAWHLLKPAKIVSED